MLQITQVAFRRRLIGAIALPIILLLSLSGVSIWQINRLLSAMHWVEHTDQVIARANGLQKLLLDLETGVRGYQLTSKPHFLEPYQQANFTINNTFDELGDLVSDNPQQSQRLRQIKAEQTGWNKSISQAIARKQKGETESLSAIELRKQSMDVMRNQITDFIATEEQLRYRRNQTVQQTTGRVIFTSIILSLAAGGVLAFYIRRQIAHVSDNYENALKTAQVQTENVQLSAQRLAALHDIDRAILAAESIKSLARTALTQMRQLVPYEQAFVALFDFQADTAEIVAGSSTKELQPLEGTKMAASDFAPEQIQQDFNYVKDLTNVELYPPVLAQLHSAGMGCCLRIPMLVEETLLGELNLAATQTAVFDAQAQDVVIEVAAQLAIAIQQSLLREQLQNYALELEQRVAERTAQLQETNQELEAFTYTISHDLRAPLRTMQGFAQALQEDYTDKLDSVGQEYIQYITEGAVQMDTLIAELLAYSRLSRAQIQMQKVDLTNVVEEALKQLSKELQEQQAEVTVAKPLPPAMAHRSTLVQVVTNLLSNAMKFVQPGIKPKLQIYAEDQQDSIQLSIVDNGIGIAPEHQERIFRVFERLHGVEIYPGTGIGLAIVRKGLERMNGRAGVESQLGTGSRFWIALPKAVLHSNDANDASTPHSDN
ncbi:CHASE3 domain-containing protein [Nostoc flagelliforme FACHB-838]|uniref:histidine kinase n=1 Tax=Nostoc flagelliforme FACHB-838 TaxID=2692904 RepID=A0ABR8DQR2_9NOSO|nr:CHASE3 domain-containing protein [Nostoc flagelliforme]MBD2531796.1 CHASE3 domain-containing protein [Nostoc flagelliforme FACHB-838]